MRQAQGGNKKIKNGSDDCHVVYKVKPLQHRQNQRAGGPALYLLQTPNQDVAAAGVDVLLQIKPVLCCGGGGGGAGLEDKACDGRLLGVREGPLQDDTC